MQKQHLLIIGFVFPEPASSAAGSRMLQLVQMFQSRGWHVTFASAAADSEFMFDLEAIGVSKVSIQLNDASFDTFVAQLQPSAVLFDRFMTEEQFGWRVAEHCPDAMRMLDTEDLHCLRQARENALKEQRSFELTDLFSPVAKREIASILRCDLSLIISEYEMELLEKQFKIDPQLLFYLPLLVENMEAETFEVLPSFSERKHFLFIGNFLHAPNRDAVAFLKQSIWPLISKQLPEAELHVYGAYPSPAVLQWHKPEARFLIKGRAEDALHVMKQARVCIAPLRFGAGIKGKLLEAMCCGTPSVTTSIGAESMHGVLPWNGTIADTPEEIALAAVQLYKDEHSWKGHQLNGNEIIKQRYLKSLFENDFMEEVAYVMQNLAFIRQTNFIGGMLMHHRVSATRYMSKWIAEKNRKQ